MSRPESSDQRPRGPRTGPRGRHPIALLPLLVLAGLLPAAPASAVSVSGFQEGGFTVPPGQTWEVDGTVETDGSVVVLGTLEMRPGDTLRFVDVDTSAFQGGGKDFLGADADKVETDVGLWVLGDGVLDAQGTPKTGWTRAPENAVGWRAADNIRVAPTARGDFAFRAYDGTNQGSFRARRAEVMNLTRDVVIEGPGHVLIRSTRPQTIRYAAFVNLGVAGVAGRYPLHFHHAAGGSRGTRVVGTVVRGGRNHAYVPHASHGITFRDTIAFNTKGEAYWWDRGDHTNAVLWDHALAARTMTALDSRSGGGPCVGGPKCQNGDFLLGRGKNMVVRDSVAVGSGLGNGFFWPSQANVHDNEWVFRNNVAHNNRFNGFGTWQNTGGKHDIRTSVAYNNGAFGISHGAYINTYRYIGVRIFGRGTAVLVHAGAARKGRRLTFRDMVIRGFRTSFEFGRHALPPGRRTRIVDTKLGKGRVLVDDEGTLTKADFIDTGLRPGRVVFAADACACSVIRIQNGARAWLVRKAGTTRIPPFFKG